MNEQDEIKQIWSEEDKMFYPEYKTENGRRGHGETLRAAAASEPITD